MYAGKLQFSSNGIGCITDSQFKDVADFFISMAKLSCKDGYNHQVPITLYTCIMHVQDFIHNYTDNSIHIGCFTT